MSAKCLVVTTAAVVPSAAITPATSDAVMWTCTTSARGTKVRAVRIVWASPLVARKITSSRPMSLRIEASSPPMTATVAPARC